MCYKNLNKLQLIIIIFITIFSVLSGSDCIEHWCTYIVDNGLNFAGDTYLEGRESNLFLFMLVIGIAEILMVFRNTFKLQMVNVLLSICRVGGTLRIPAYVLVEELVCGIMGGLIRDTYTITPIGYIVLILSWIILILDIRLAFIKGRRS